MNKQQIIQNFDPSQPGLAAESIFGLPFTADQSEIVIIPVPWEVTVSYGAGASDGPSAILEASFQVDLHHQEYPELWKLGIHLDLNKQTETWANDSITFKKTAQQIIRAIESGDDISKNEVLSNDLKKINNKCQNFIAEVKSRTLFWLEQGKKVALLGGDHSTPLGYYQALASKHKSFGILHIDAHMDLRIAYEGFEYSHASIMYNALQIDEITKIVQVGIRDFCKQEVEIAKSNAVIVHTDIDIKAKSFTGTTWHDQCTEIINQLPDKVTVSFDIDGLQAWYCPNTGTPVPGGLSFEQASYLLNLLANSNKEIIGFDLVEVAPGNDDWDGNVGARMLFQMCGMLAKNNGLPVGDKIIFEQ
ncbi:MAG: Agmatinase [Bacteroidota bacterium]|jgi:agmatinase